MNIAFVEESWEDYVYWHSTNPKILKKINELLKDISRDPFAGIGKPEPLKHEFKGLWSRRIDLEHRLVYQIIENEIVVLKSRFHY